VRRTSESHLHSGTIPNAWTFGSGGSQSSKLMHIGRDIYLAAAELLLQELQLHDKGLMPDARRMQLPLQ